MHIKQTLGRLRPTTTKERPECHKFACSTMKNNSFARFARAFFHFCSFRSPSCPINNLNALNAVGALMTLIDFILSNVRRFYSSMRNPLAVKGLNDLFCSSVDDVTTRRQISIFSYNLQIAHINRPYSNSQY